MEEGRYHGLPVYEMPGSKFGRYHHRGEVCTADGMRLEADPPDEALLRQFGERYFPDGSSPTTALRTCLFTNTPDEHFVIDRHPEHHQAVLASPASGHGSKFCPVVGEILADFVTGDETTRHEIGCLRLGRTILMALQAGSENRTR